MSGGKSAITAAVLGLAGLAAPAAAEEAPASRPAGANPPMYAQSAQPASRTERKVGDRWTFTLSLGYWTARGWLGVDDGIADGLSLTASVAADVFWPWPNVSFGSVVSESYVRAEGTSFKSRNEVARLGYLWRWGTHAGCWPRLGYRLSSWNETRPGESEERFHDPIKAVLELPFVSLPFPHAFMTLGPVVDTDFDDYVALSFDGSIGIWW